MRYRESYLVKLTTGAVTFSFGRRESESSWCITRYTSVSPMVTIKSEVKKIFRLVYTRGNSCQHTRVREPHNTQLVMMLRERERQT